MGAVKQWCVRNPDRQILVGILAAAIVACVALLALPGNVADQVIALMLPSSGRGGVVREALLSSHRVTFGVLVVILVGVVAGLPGLAGLVDRSLRALESVDRRVFLLVLAVLIVGSRAALVDLMLPIIPGQDTGHYHQLATTLLDEGTFIERASHPGEPDGDRAWRLPGYPAALAVALAVSGRDDRAVVWLNTFWALVLSFATYGFVRTLGTEGSARLSALAVAIYPTMITASLRALNELQFASLLVLTLYLLFRLTGARGYIAAGLTFGLATMTRGNGLLLFLAFLVLSPLWISWLRARGARWNRSQALGRVALVTVGFCIVVAPWVVRNRYVTGHWVGIATSGGANMWIGHHPGGSGLHGSEFIFPDELAQDEVGRSAYGSAQAIRYWIEHPVENLKISVRIMQEILKVDSGITAIVFPEGRPSGRARKATYYALWGSANAIYYALWGLVGVWLVAFLLKSWPGSEAPGILILTAVLYIGTYVPFLGWGRYKVPALPLLVAAGVLILAALCTTTSRAEALDSGTPDAAGATPR